jgi:hypothetical protein
MSTEASGSENACMPHEATRGLRAVIGEPHKERSRCRVDLVEKRRLDGTEGKRVCDGSISGILNPLARHARAFQLRAARDEKRQPDHGAGVSGGQCRPPSYSACRRMIQRCPPCKKALTALALPPRSGFWRLVCFIPLFDGIWIAPPALPSVHRWRGRTLHAEKA